MAFWREAPNALSSYMLGANVTTAGFTDQGMPFVEDYYINDYHECSIDERHVPCGVCLVSMYSGSDSINSTHLVYGHQKDDISFSRYQWF